MDTEMMQWISQHRNDDTSRLLLRYHGQDWISQAVTQIICRRRCTGKIPSFLSHETFMFPHSLSAEQCTSERVAAFHASLIAKGSHVLDMTAGLGIDAMTMAASECNVVAIEKNQDAAYALRHNAKALGLKTIDVINADSVEWLSKNSENHFDYIFIDPARRDSHGGRMRAFSDCEPDVCQLLPTLLQNAPTIVVKASPMLDITKTIAELGSSAEEGCVERICAVGTETECKEILAVVGRGKSKPNVEAITLLNDGRISEVKATTSVPQLLTSEPKEGMWLYEPYPSVMKLMNRFSPADKSLYKLDRDTNLYISEGYVTDFPGIAMSIEKIEDFNDKNLKKFGKECGKANVATRNFIISAPELVKRLRIKEGGTKRIYGTRINGRLKLIQTAPPETKR